MSSKVILQVKSNPVVVLEVKDSSDKVYELIVFEAHLGQTLLDAVHDNLDNGRDLLEGSCGGCACCATCHVIDSNEKGILNEISIQEDDMINSLDNCDEFSRLSCQIILDKPIVYKFQIPLSTRANLNNALK